MRITNKTMNNNMLRNLNNSMQRLDRFNYQLSTGQRIRVPSDDPVAANTVLRLKATYNENEQYLKNANDGISWLEATDGVLGETTKILHRARELAGNGGSALDEESRLALAREVEQLFDNVLQLANSSHGGRFLFAGEKTLKAPFESASDGEGGKLTVPTYVGDDGEIKHDLAASSSIVLNITGDTVFDDIFSALADIHNSLVEGNTEKLGSQCLEDLDKSLNTLLKSRSEMGAKVNRLELAKERLLDLRINLSDLLGQANSVDYAETIMHLKNEEVIYRTALSVGARLIQPSLVDFLR